VGGDFFTQKKYLSRRESPRFRQKGRYIERGTEANPSDYADFEYHGRFLPVQPAFERFFPAARDSSRSTIEMAGTKAIALCAPTNSLVNLSVFLAELVREGIKLPFEAQWKGVAARARDAGDQYLNIEFGWKPLISDVKRVAQQIAWAENIVHQFERDAGKLVRRRFDFPIVRETSFSSNETIAAPYPGIVDTRQLRVATPTGSMDVSTSFSQHRWFSGAFTYHLPTDWNSRKVMREARSRIRAVLRSDIDPETLWNLTPWSWAVDWFSSAGDVIHNLNAWSKYGLVLRYGYVMEHTLNETTYTRRMPTPLLVGQYPSDSTCSASFCTETKKRYRANPFGFGVSWEGLNPTQISILGALGITKSSK
jgi:hypothetical protein